jgi:dTDP-4-amino-4,6-dideoxygalactose transaminase
MLGAAMAVPLLDLTRNDPAFQQELEAAALGVLRSGRFILGPEVEGLEQELATYLGSRHVIALSSGTDALLVALMALGIGPGDEVAVPVYSFFATAGVVSRLNARPVFVDVEPEWKNIDPKALEHVLQRHTKIKAVIPVHLYGAPAAMTALQRLCSARNVPMIEDAAQAIGTRCWGPMAGTIGLAGAFSTFPSKNLGGPGDGGFLCTNDSDFAHRVRQLRNHGQSDAYRHERVGGNFRMDALQAAILRVQLRRLEQLTTKRRENANRYRIVFANAGLGEDVQLPQDVGDRHTYHQFVVHFEDEPRRDAVRAALVQKQIGCSVYYPLPFHKQPCWQNLGYQDGDFPVAEAAANTNLALPIFPGLTGDEQRAVVDAIAQVL